jgi:hypothetical protein
MRLNPGDIQTTEVDELINNTAFHQPSFTKDVQIGAAMTGDLWGLFIAPTQLFQ